MAKTIRELAEDYLGEWLESKKVDQFTQEFTDEWYWYLLVDANSVDDADFQIWMEDCAVWISDKLDELEIEPKYKDCDDDLYECFSMDAFTDEAADLVDFARRKCEKEVIGL
jgi:hypothetical protein